jgi:large subunit ribosomal protein L10
MSLNLSEKQAVVAEVAEIANNSHSAIAAEYRGLSVSQMTDLRSRSRKNGVYLRVVKNTLAKRALENTDFECMGDSLVGPLILAFSRDDPGAAARVFKDFLKEKENGKLVVKTLSIGGQMLPPSDIERLANMPTREQALSMLLACMRAPLDKFARTLNEVPGKFVRTLAALREQKETT